MRSQKSKDQINDFTADYLSEQVGNQVDQFEGQLETIRSWIDQLTSTLPGEPADQGSQKLEAYQSLSVAIEELSVAGEELRLQNEQLIQSREELEESRHKYEDLFEFAPDGYIVTDLFGKIEEINQAGCKQFNLQKHFLLGKPLTALIARPHRRIFIDWLISFRTGEHDNLYFETSIQPRHAAQLDVAVTAGLIRTPQRDLIGIRWLVRDIHERRDYEVKLYDSEMRFHTVFGEAEIGIVLLNLNEDIQVANPALQRILDLNEENISGWPFSRFIHADDQEYWRSAFNLVIDNKQGSQRLQVRLIGKGNLEVPVRLALSLVRTAFGKPDYIILIVDNISDERRMEQELIDVEGRLTDASERERVRLAQNLHDGPLQDLYGILYQLKMVSLGKLDEATYANLDSAQNMLQQTIDQLRDTTGGLRPPTLAHFGLERAMRSFVDSIRDIAPHLKITLDLQKDNDTLTERVRTALFRIFQQCMMNVVRHSHAKHSDVRLKFDAHEILLEVKDDGVGFTVPKRWKELIAGGHYGLVGAAERAVSVGGKLLVYSLPGRGTLMRVIVPRRAEDQVQKERLSVEISDRPWMITGEKKD